MYRKLLKPLFDFILALTLFIVFLPLFVLIAILVKLSSEGPVFFRQQRGGRFGKYFDILKFRTMTVKKESDGKDFDAGGCARITSVGKVLRKTKLDELPQLINVIRGEMSLVGPRPEVRVYIELYPERWEKVHSVMPGITDPASVVFRNEEEILAEASDPETEYRENILPRKLDLYEQYVENISFSEDLKVLIKTVFAVLMG